jgi:hypothetical protein
MQSSSKQGYSIQEIIAEYSRSRWFCTSLSDAEKRGICLQQLPSPHRNRGDGLTPWMHRVCLTILRCRWRDHGDEGDQELVHRRGGVEPGEMPCVANDFDARLRHIMPHQFEPGGAGAGLQGNPKAFGIDVGAEDCRPPGVRRRVACPAIPGMASKIIP